MTPPDSRRSASPPAVQRIAIVGGASLTAQCLTMAIEAGTDVGLVITDLPAVAAAAAEHGVLVVPTSADLAAELRARGIDGLLSIAHLVLVPQAALDAVAVAVNFHDGRLPDYAGLDVTSWALWNGETEHAITWHLMTADADTGDVLLTESFPIAADETAFSLNARCYEAAIATFPEVLDGLCHGTLDPTPQPPGPRRLYLRRERPTSVIDPGRPAAELERAVRALSLGHQAVNGQGCVRLVGPGGALVVTGAHASSGGEGPAGRVTLVADALHVTTTDGALLVSGLETTAGRTVDGGEALDLLGLRDGDALPDLGDLPARLADTDPELVVHEAAWRQRLAGVETAAPPTLAAVAADGPVHERELTTSASPADIVAAVAAWSWRLAPGATTTIAVTDPASRATTARLEPLLRDPIVRVDLTADTTFAELARTVEVELDGATARGPFLADLVGRDPAWRGSDPTPAVRIDLDAADTITGRPDDPALVVAIGPGGTRLRSRLGHDELARLTDQVATLLDGGLTDRDVAVAELPLLGDAERSLLDAVNHTDLDHDRTATVDGQIRARVSRTPDAPAVTAAGRTLTYRELDESSRRLARRLHALGVRSGDRVGVAVGRTTDLAVALLAVLRSGAAYVPLDPTYPIDRLTFMVADSGVRVVVADGALDLGDGLVVVDPADATGPGDAPGEQDHGPADLAYVIYTSGSTGTPKGVMLGHGNVVNFFAAMDEVIDHDPPGTWLAVTSLSFDISVLELLWTLTHGFHVVVQAERSAAHRRATPRPAPAADPDAPPTTMSLFYFAAGEASAGDGYRLLLESARWADEHGFEAVWTPERHFHEFGGAYPNPSVTSAALAAVTERIAIRAGSVVAPLHAPARIAEEWAVVDNLSGGRVGISFAAGWQPNDFVLNPSGYDGARGRLAETIETIRRLWRGETIELPGHDGQPVPVRTLPRPVQAELPVWLTSAGSPATFEEAGRLGMNLLTHLLGQSVEQLAANIERYRAAWSEAGHPGRGRITLMLHTYLHDDREVARRTAHDPLKGYLGTATGLIKNMASAFPTFARAGADADEAFRSLSDDELDQLLEMAASRYLDTSGLFGTVDDAVEMVERCTAVGVDEIACLVDFGVDTDAVLESLPRLGAVRARIAERRDDAAAPGGHDDATFAELVTAHGATHLQCTPSLATMLLADPADRAALATIGHVMLGGEALPTALAAELRRLLPGRFTNMYGPTETTIWSLVHEIDEVPDGPIPIGRPIANNRVAILDGQGQPVPIGAWGELHIAGEGVARGYHDRPELTAERFVDRPALGRTYATGDIARIRDDGVVEFAGRSDHQVKIRGHRIELGEIETVIDRDPDVVQSVVVAHRRPVGDPLLVAFLVTRDGAPVEPDRVRGLVADALPDAYVPSRVVRLREFPLTPNGKTDRGRLLADIDTYLAETVAPAVDLDDDRERLIAEIWTGELGRAPGRDDNFFDIGGNSLLAVAVFRRITDATDAELALTDVFRFPTVRTFAAHLATRDGGAATTATTPAPAATTTPTSGVDRGELRRRARARR